VPFEFKVTFKHGLVEVAGQAYVVEELLLELVHPEITSEVAVQLPAIEMPGLLDLLQLSTEAKSITDMIVVKNFIEIGF
jgi:hypothetical protein